MMMCIKTCSSRYRIWSWQHWNSAICFNTAFFSLFLFIGDKKVYKRNMKILQSFCFSSTLQIQWFSSTLLLQLLRNIRFSFRLLFLNSRFARNNYSWNKSELGSDAIDLWSVTFWRNTNLQIRIRVIDRALDQIEETCRPQTNFSED